MTLATTFQHFQALLCLHLRASLLVYLPCLDLKTSSIIAVSMVHSEPDYCNTPYTHRLLTASCNKQDNIQANTMHHHEVLHQKCGL